MIVATEMAKYAKSSLSQNRVPSRIASIIAKSVIFLSSWTCALAVTSPAFAYGGTAWGPLTMVTIYRGSARPGALLQPSATFTNGDNCPHPENLFIDFSTTEAPDGKALYATALAAQLAGKSVSIGTLGCSSEGFPVVYGINVQ